jgi:diaminopimelate decarboxylase
MKLPASILEFINSRSNRDFEPYYVYNSAIIREHCRAFQQIAYANKAIHFASMANIHPEFLRIVKEENTGVFVNSLIHLDAAISAGFREKEIVFTASGLTNKAMMAAHDHKVQVNLDSPGQLERWQQLFPGEAVGLRCNIGDSVQPQASHVGCFIGKESRLGFLPEELDAIQDKSIINGLHLYAGTDIFDVDYFIRCYSELIRISEMFPAISYLNFGGGFGVSEDNHIHFDMARYTAEVSRLMNDFSEKRGRSIRLILEPGRIIGGESGYFVCQVSDVKKRNDVLLVGVNASTAQFSRPLMYPDVASHPVVVVHNGVAISDGPLQNTTIFGCSTYSRDLFLKNRLLPEIQTGDTLVFGNAGSYSASSFTQFLGFPKPAEFFL